jgi:predicted nucleic acid-binding protein
VSRTVILDSGPLGLLSRPRRVPPALACAAWLRSLLAAGVRVIHPEIADYEVRRELLRLGSVRGVAQLDRLAARIQYLPLTTPAMRLAAELWAQARQQGQPTAGDKTIDADVILAAQALSLGDPAVVVATTNAGHLARFVPADDWQNIAP